MEDIKNINRLLGQVKTITKSYERVNEAIGGNFNIFSVLRIESDEERTHSRFLAELLNPEGVHGCKDAFLKLFVEGMPVEIKSLNTKNCKVTTEARAKEGIIDILIKEDNHPKVIMIENKIYAREQPDQLLRYKNSFPNGELLFLTLDGRDSDQTSSKDIYTPISYKENIIAWLEECKKVVVDKPIIRETITQYIHLIKKLTNSNINSEMDRKLLELFIKDREDFKAFKEIKNLDIYEIHKIVLEDLKPTLECIAKDNSITLSPGDDIENPWTEDMKDHKHDIYPKFYFHSPNLNGDRIRICFEFYINKKSTISSRFYFGFYYHPPSSESSLRPDDEKLKEKFGNVFGLNEWWHKDYWLCTKNYDGYEDWGNLDTLEKIIFGDFKKDIKSKIETIGDFKKDIKSKIETMLKMLKEHSVVNKD